jgi:SAM-dependent methyltransferase
LGASDRFRYVVGDIYRLPFAAGAFSAATMIRTLHHMAEPARAIAAVRESLRPGSPLVLEYPNKRNLKAIARWLAGRQAWSPFAQEPVEFARLNYDFHPRAVRSWLTESGFAIRRQLTVSHFRTGLLKRIVPVGLLVSLDSAAQWTGDFLQFSPSIFTLALAVGADSSEGRGFWRCPECRSVKLHEVGQGQRCSDCGRIWGLREGIWDFRDPVV